MYIIKNIFIIYLLFIFFYNWILLIYYRFYSFIICYLLMIIYVGYSFVWFCYFVFVNRMVMSLNLWLFYVERYLCLLFFIYLWFYVFVNFYLFFYVMICLSKVFNVNMKEILIYLGRCCYIIVLKSIYLSYIWIDYLLLFK